MIRTGRQTLLRAYRKGFLNQASTDPNATYPESAFPFLLNKNSVLQNTPGSNAERPLCRWCHTNTIIPNPYNPLDWDRYVYARNSPVRCNDPSGHCPVCIAIGLGVALVVWLANPDPVYAPSPGFTLPTVVDPSYGDKAYFDAAPGSGDLSDIYAAATGHTLFTGEEISGQDRIVAGAFSLLPIASSAGFRQGRKFITGIDNLIPGSNTVVRRITGKLDLTTKNKLRVEARSIFYNANPGLKDIGLQVHHRIPLEWSHLFPDADPNRLSNLIGLDKTVHIGISESWNEFRDRYIQLGRDPTAQEVLNFAAGLDYGN